MKRRGLILILIVLISVITIYRLNNKNNICYTSLGDGYSKGINPYGEIDYGYSDYLKDYLIKKDKLNNYTKSFSDKSMSIELLYSYIVTNKKIANKNIKQVLRESEIVTLSIGLNDLIYKLSITENIDDYKLNKIIDEIDKSLDVLLKEINKYYSKKIYIIAYYSKSNNNDTYLLKGINKLNNLYKTKKNIILIKSSKLENNHSKYFSNPNSYYPNKEGYKEICSKIIKKLEK